ncbi:MAG TPA: lysophospholipid acyltransferase family protein [Candidatus Cybelea sp.]|jgi:1-acyl-sn-glycerol-3-phosphate acyltransferase|nr:lysophospholipid acyltransferase family protein [Candidatus Cybelea sp.]
MNRRFYDFSKFFVSTMARLVWRARVFGTENVPASGRLIIACNHISYYDPPFLGSLCPRRIRYMAKKELFEIPILGSVIRALGAYSVDRQGSATGAIKRSLHVLESGGTIGIFPEGRRRRGGPAPAQTGVALLAALAGAPVVPACVHGTDRALRFGRVDVAFGAPLALPAGRKATRDDLAKFAADIMKSIETLAESIGGNT